MWYTLSSIIEEKPCRRRAFVFELNYSVRIGKKPVLLQLLGALVFTGCTSEMQ